jgi:hypothetical protein
MTEPIPRSNFFKKNTISADARARALNIMYVLMGDGRPQRDGPRHRGGNSNGKRVFYVRYTPAEVE